MESLFLKVLNLSFLSSLIIIGILMMRVLLKNTKRKYFMLMWGILALRLMLPISIETKIAILPSINTIPNEIIYSQEPQIQSGIEMVDEIVNPIVSETLTPYPGSSVNPIQVYLGIGAQIWLLGMIIFIINAIFSYLHLRRQLSESISSEGKIYFCDHIQTPFILGMFNSKIYLPSNLHQEDYAYVIDHEKAHLKHFDHFSKPLGFMLLVVYWFNPLFWIAYHCFCKDMELACDEAVVEMMDSLAKKEYAKALLRCSVKEHYLSVCPLAFGEVAIQQRLQYILKGKKPKTWILILSFVCLLFVFVFSFLSPSTDIKNGLGLYYSHETLANDGIEYAIIDGTINSVQPVLKVTYTNKSNQVISYTSDFIIYKNDKIYEPKIELAFDQIVHTIDPNQTKVETYILTNYEFSKGDYRLVQMFDDIEIGVEFSIDATYDFVGLQYKVSQVEMPVDSNSTVGHLQFVVYDTHLTLLTNDYPEPSPSSSFYRLGRLKKIDISEIDIDYQKDTQLAFYVEDKVGRIYYWLVQKDGQIIVIKKDGETSILHLSKINEMPLP